MSGLQGTTGPGRGASALAIPRARSLRLVAVRRKDVTLAEAVPAFLRWFAHVRQRTENTVRSYAFDLRDFLRFCDGLSLERPRQVTFREVELYMARLQERGLAPTTVNRHLNALRQLWRYLNREGVAVGNPAADVFSVREPTKLPRYLSIPEQERVLAEMAEDRSLVGRRDYALVATALFTGLRVEELVCLRVADVDLDAGILRVEAGKGGKGRELPVVPRLREILRDYLREARPRLVERPRGNVVAVGRTTWRLYSWEGRKEIAHVVQAASEGEARRMLEEFFPRPPAPPWLFVNAHPTNGYRFRRVGEPLLTRSVFHIVRRQVAARVGRPVSPHMLRHSFASRLRANGADLQLIQEALGHSTISTTTMYAHLSTSRRREELARLLGDDGGGGR